ncbi:ribonuclease 3-like [Carica papaya]|uniref:ribonuclease 3-like n=1 Tax=Carica papaya TaxID=3649 RepID=UPI000B8CCE72|nr:ribonuclease 3-like [Carica papaya]
MKLNYSAIVNLLIILQFLSLDCFSLSQDFDFFYFVQQWPGSYCDTKHSCCYPKSGKPAADFGIHGLWPNYNDGSYPSNCNPDSVFDKSQISDLKSSLEKNWPTLSCPSNDGTKFWTHEWVKHGTCSESELDQREYFEAALKLKDKINLLKILNIAGIKADDGFYELDEIRKAIEEESGVSVGIECNVDSYGNSQLYQIYMCVDTSGSQFIQCPLLPRHRCGSSVQFPKF